MPEDKSLFVGVDLPPALVEQVYALTEAGRESVKLSGGRAKTSGQIGKELVEDLLAKATALPQPVLEANVAIAPVHIEPPAPILSLENACEVVVSFLDEHSQNLIRALARESQRPVASYIMSAVLLAREQGRIGVVMGEWADKRPTDTLIPKAAVSTCAYCGHEFTPTRDGQQFCPPPPDDSDSCGHKHGLEAIHTERAQRLARRSPSPFEPKFSPIVPR